MMDEEMSDLMKMAKGMTEGPVDLRRTEVDDFIVSTVQTPDMGPETAIVDSNGKARPVARYNTAKEALDDHERWVEWLRAGNRTITELGYGRLAEEQTVTLGSGGTR